MNRLGAQHDSEYQPSIGKAAYSIPSYSTTMAALVGVLLFVVIALSYRLWKLRQVG
jgi:hypothetical protein